MIGSTAIFETVKTMIEAANPGKTVYVDDIPKNFTRPSFLLEQISRSETDIAKGLKQVTIGMTVTCFTLLSPHGIAKQEDLIVARAGIMALFAPGYIRVDDRAPRVTATAGEVDLLAAFVDARIEYAESAREDTTNYELMGSVTIERKL